MPYFSTLKKFFERFSCTITINLAKKFLQVASNFLLRWRISLYQCISWPCHSTGPFPICKLTLVQHSGMHAELVHVLITRRYPNFTSYNTGILTLPNHSFTSLNKIFSNSDDLKAFWKAILNKDDSWTLVWFSLTAEPIHIFFEYPELSAHFGSYFGHLFACFSRIIMSKTEISLVFVCTKIGPDKTETQTLHNISNALTIHEIKILKQFFYIWSQIWCKCYWDDCCFLVAEEIHSLVKQYYPFLQINANMSSLHQSALQFLFMKTIFSVLWFCGLNIFWAVLGIRF